MCGFFSDFHNKKEPESSKNQTSESKFFEQKDNKSDSSPNLSHPVKEERPSRPPSFMASTP